MKKEFIMGNYERVAQAKTSWFGFRSSIELGYEERIESEDVILLDGCNFVCTLITTEGHRILVWKESENPDGLTGDCNIYRDEYDEVYCYRTQKICEGTQMEFVSKVLTNLGLSGAIYDLDFNDEATPEAYEEVWQSFLHGLEQFVTGKSLSFTNTGNWIENGDIKGFNATVITSETHHTFAFNKQIFQGKYEWSEWFFEEWKLGSETIIYKTVSADGLSAAFAHHCLSKVKEKPNTAESTIVTDTQAQKELQVQERLANIESAINGLKNTLRAILKTIHK